MSHYWRLSEVCLFTEPSVFSLLFRCEACCHHSPQLVHNLWLHFFTLRNVCCTSTVSVALLGINHPPNSNISIALLVYQNTKTTVLGLGHQVWVLGLFSPWKDFNPWFTFACGALSDGNTTPQWLLPLVLLWFFDITEKVITQLNLFLWMHRFHGH